MDNLKKKWLMDHLTDVAAYGGLIFCILLFTIVTPIFGNSIWSVDKLETLVSNVIVLALMSVGAVFVYATGNMDISIGRQIGLYSTLMVIIGNATGNLVLGILLCLLIAMIIGVTNAVAGELLHIVSVIPSLVFMMLIQGILSIVYTKMGSRSISLTSVDYHLFKNTWFMVLVLVLEIAFVSYVFYFTKLGKQARAVGANPVSASQSGVSISKCKMGCYMIMGICIVIASMFQMGYTGSASENTGTGMEMNVIVALILGGMPLSGGMKAKVRCAVIGAFTYSLLNVGLPLMKVSTSQVYLIKAVIFLAVVLITCRKKNGVLPR